MVVLEIGTGSGLLAMLAVRGGARRRRRPVFYVRAAGQERGRSRVRHRGEPQSGALVVGWARVCVGGGLMGGAG